MFDIIKIWFGSLISKISIGILVALLLYTSILYVQNNSKAETISILQKEQGELKAKCTQPKEELEDAKIVLDLKTDQNKKEADTKINYIIKYKKDKHETDCEAANRLMRANPISW